jgi:hypothetical protein
MVLLVVAVHGYTSCWESVLYLPLALRDTIIWERYHLFFLKTAVKDCG